MHEALNNLTIWMQPAFQHGVKINEHIHEQFTPKVHITSQNVNPQDGLEGVVHINSKHEHVDMYHGRIVKDDLETELRDKTGDMVEKLKEEDKQVFELETMIKKSSKEQRLRQGGRKKYGGNATHVNK